MPPSVWGGEHLHVGLHSKLEGEHAKLEGLERIRKASSLSTDELLSRCFPSGTNGNGAPPSAECTMVDLGCGYGGTARVATKKLGCKVGRYNAACCDVYQMPRVEDQRRGRGGNGMLLTCLIAGQGLGACVMSD
ncbi:unnamed protein product [Ectocarpus sp. CCAP 1310/34]|nr:unnamed protein product [Ectocarpus sp. CCAP 1310/34]